MIFHKKLEAYIESNNIKAVKNIDFEKRSIKYNEKIKQHNKIENIPGEEEKVRAFLLTRLSNELGYKLNNLEIEKSYSIGRRSGSKARIDVIVRDDDDNVFMFIELKSPGEFEKDSERTIEDQLYSIAPQEEIEGSSIKYLVLYTYEIKDKQIKDKCVVIDYEKYKTFKSWKEDPNSTDTLPARYGKSEKEPFIKNGNKDLIKQYSSDEIDSLRRDLHDYLWSGGTGDNEIFNSFVNLLLAKIQDESEKTDGEKYDFQIFRTKDDESFESNDELFERINKLYKRALKERLYITDEDKLNNASVINKNKMDLNRFKYTITKLEKYSFVDGKNSLEGKDVLGDFFEGIVSQGFKQSKGQFFTHKNIVNTLLFGLQLDDLAINTVNNENRLPLMIDPSVGSGTFLIEYMKFITNTLKRDQVEKLQTKRDVQDNLDSWFMPDNRENRWAKDHLYGIENDFDLGSAAKVNMILHGDGSTNIFIKDGLSSFDHYVNENKHNFLNFNEDGGEYKKKINGKFDVVLSNPPFTIKIDENTKEIIKKTFIFGEIDVSESLFIERYYQLLRENGRLGVVLPESIFDTPSQTYIRLFLLKYFKIKSIVSLPQISFKPYTDTKTSLLFAQKKTASELNDWNEHWNVSSKNWSKLVTRVQNLLDVYVLGKDRKNLKSINSITEKDEKIIIEKALEGTIQENELKVNKSGDLFVKYKEELTNFCKHDKKLENEFGFVNPSWVFNDMSKNINYDIFMAEAENVGYKITTRQNLMRPNDLFDLTPEGKINYDQNGKKILNFLRKIQWD